MAGMGTTGMPRVGVGVDVHAFAPEGSDRALWVAGLHWPGERGLEGHSDADVACHASSSPAKNPSDSGVGVDCADAAT